MADDENELLALLGNGSIRGSDHERGRVGESWEQAQALPRLSPLFWTKGASVGMFVELRVSSRRASSIGYCILPSRAEESANQAGSDHAKAGGDGAANPESTHHMQVMSLGRGWWGHNVGTKHDHVASRDIGEMVSRGHESVRRDPWCLSRCRFSN